MKSYAIFADAGGDLSPALAAAFDVGYVPMEYTLDGVSARHALSEDLEAVCGTFYDSLRAGKSISTSQITPHIFEETFAPVLEAGQDILYACFSSGISSTWNSAQVASEKLRQAYPERTIRCVDTLSASGGGGVAALYAAVNREQGMSLSENADWLAQRAQAICHWFTVDDLDFLKRGGRISPTLAFVGGMLSIKPVLVILPDGTLSVTGKVRGRRAAMRSLVDSYRAHRTEEPGQIILISHAGCPEQGQELLEMVRAEAPDGARLYLVPLSPIIGAHTGPHMMAVCHLGTSR